MYRSRTWKVGQEFKTSLKKKKTKIKQKPEDRKTMSNMVLSRCVFVSVLIMQEFAFNGVLWPRLGFESQTQDFYFNQIAVTLT